MGAGEITLSVDEFPERIYSKTILKASGSPSLANKSLEIAEKDELIPILARVTGN